MLTLLLLVTSGLVLIALIVLQGLAISSQLSETVEAVNNSPWEHL